MTSFAPQDHFKRCKRTSRIMSMNTATMSESKNLPCAVATASVTRTALLWMTCFAVISVSVGAPLSSSDTFVPDAAEDDGNHSAASVTFSLPTDDNETMDCGMGTHKEDTQMAEALERADRRYRKRLRRQAGSHTQLNIGVIWHVIHDGSDGLLSDGRIQRQVDVMTDAFAGKQDSIATDAKMSFYLAGVRRVDHSCWHAECRTRDDEIKRALAIRPSEYMNVYSCGNIGSGTLGWAVFPWWSNPSLGDANWGFFIVDRIIPPATGPLTGTLDAGDVAVHEVGHLFGLLHTFQDGPGGQSGCFYGDFVEDTPNEATPHWGCSFANSCTNDDHLFTGPGQSPLDPMWSFMSYANNICQTRFSDGQVSRMRAVISQYLPDLEVASQRTPEIITVPVAVPGQKGTMSCGTRVTGDTGIGSVYSIGQASGEHIYAFTATNSGVHVFNGCASTFDTWLRVWDATLDNEIAQCDDCGGCGTQTSLSVSLVAGRTYNLIIEGYACNQGSYDVTLECPLAPPPVNTPGPTRSPTRVPTRSPTRTPSTSPTSSPTSSPTTRPPTNAPTESPSARPEFISIVTMPSQVGKPLDRGADFRVRIRYAASSRVKLVTIIRHPASRGVNFQLGTSTAAGDMNNLPAEGEIDIDVSTRSTAAAIPGYTLEFVLLRAGQAWGSRFAFSQRESFDLFSITAEPTVAPTSSPLDIGVVIESAESTIDRSQGSLILPTTISYAAESRVRIVVLVKNTATPGVNYEFQSRRSDGTSLQDLPPSGTITVHVRCGSWSPSSDTYEAQLVLLEAGGGWSSRFAFSQKVPFAIVDSIGSPAPLPTALPTSETIVATPIATTASASDSPITLRVPIVYSASTRVRLVILVTNTAFPGEKYEFRSTAVNGANLRDLPSSASMEIDVKLGSWSPVSDSYRLQFVMLRAGSGWSSRFAFSNVVEFEVVE